MSVTPFKTWLCMSALLCAAFFLFPALRPCISVVVIALLAVFIRGIISIRSNFFCRVYCSKPGEIEKLCLTFDDGPDPGLTNDVLDMLGRYGFTATFFVIGNKSANHPEIVKKAFDLGHTIACHDLTHDNASNFRMSRALLRDISESRRIIEAIIHKKPLLYRPPIGLMNPHVPGVLKQLNMQCIGWNKSVKDAGNRRQKRFTVFPKLAQPGSIILLHDCLPKPELKKEFLDNLEKLFQIIKEKGLRPVGVGDLFNFNEYED
jgi:peptidoglycan/xylan/chitin deacetylase (PgdA/CDA1 family)